MRLLEGEKINGPYPHRNKWRLVIWAPDGAQRKITFDTRQAAEDALGKLRHGPDGGTIENAVNAFLDYLRDKGVKASSIQTHRYRFRAFFGLGKKKKSNDGGPLRALTRERAQQLYDATCEKHAVDTHRNSLQLAKTFAQWCVKKGWLAANPFADIEPRGRRKRGKDQLRVNEARTFLTTCCDLGDQGDVGAIAAMTALLLGMRGSEVVQRVVRDLDDDGRLLWIPSAKTDAGRRTLEIPELLQPYLLACAKGKRSSDRLFTTKDRHWLLYHVRRICALADLPPITAHSLRGLHATLATVHGATGPVVAAALGHTSFHTTEAHYLQPGTGDRVARQRVQSLVAPEMRVRKTDGTGSGGEIFSSPFPHSRDSDPT